MSQKPVPLTCMRFGSLNVKLFSLRTFSRRQVNVLAEIYSFEQKRANVFSPTGTSNLVVIRLGNRLEKIVEMCNILNMYYKIFLK